MYPIYLWTYYNLANQPLNILQCIQSMFEHITLYPIYLVSIINKKSIPSVNLCRLIEEDGFLFLQLYCPLVDRVLKVTVRHARCSQSWCSELKENNLRKWKLFKLDPKILQTLFRPYMCCYNGCNDTFSLKLCQKKFQNSFIALLHAILNIYYMTK